MDTALVNDIITPIVSIPGRVNFANLSVKIGSEIQYGDFLRELFAL